MLIKHEDQGLSKGMTEKVSEPLCYISLLDQIILVQRLFSQVRHIVNTTESPLPGYLLLDQITFLKVLIYRGLLSFIFLES